MKIIITDILCSDPSRLYSETLIAKLWTDSVVLRPEKQGRPVHVKDDA